jgi:uncharacterized protein (UPF0218 family)
MKETEKYAIGYHTTDAKTVGDVTTQEIVTHLYGMDGHILQFDNKTKAQGALDFMRTQWPHLVEELKEAKIIPLTLFRP